MLHIKQSENQRADLFFSSVIVNPDMICNRGIGAGSGPYIAIHEGFQGVIAAFVLDFFCIRTDKQPSFRLSIQPAIWEGYVVFLTIWGFCYSTTCRFLLLSNIPDSLPALTGLLWISIR
jgi:hypothetical protein